MATIIYVEAKEGRLRTGEIVYRAWAGDHAHAKCWFDIDTRNLGVRNRGSGSVIYYYDSRSDKSGWYTLLPHCKHSE